MASFGIPNECSPQPDTYMHWAGRTTPHASGAPIALAAMTYSISCTDHPWDQIVRTAGESNADGGDDVIQCRRYSAPLFDVTNGSRIQHFYALAEACQRDSGLSADHVAEGDPGGGPCPIAQQNIPAHSAPGVSRRASGVRTLGRHRGKHTLQFLSADAALLPWRRVG
jgi:hypothetical protein